MPVPAKYTIATIDMTRVSALLAALDQVRAIGMPDDIAAEHVGRHWRALSAAEREAALRALRQQSRHDLAQLQELLT